MKTTMTITAPTEKAGQQAIFTIEFDKANFDETVENVSLITKDSDVLLGQEMGWWRVV